MERVSERSGGSTGRHVHLHSTKAELVRKHILRFRFTVDEMDVPEFTGLGAYTFNPLEQFVSISMGAVTVQDLHSCPQRNFVTEDADRGLAFNDTSAESVFGLKPYYKDGVAWVMSAVHEVVHDAARFSHSRRGNDDERATQRVQRLRFVDSSGVLDQVETEQLFYLTHQILASIEAVWMHLKDGGDIRRQRAIDENGDLWDQSLAGQRVQVVEKFLRSSNRECGNHDMTAARSSFRNDCRQPSSHVFRRLMRTVSIRRFHDDGVCATWNHRVADDRQSPPSNVGRKNQPTLGAIL